ncbi:DUF771 domain-containing protein [Lysinibacillus sp. CNPSo 3705]|uniref:DUF771 domain-containing protein n=1 Tax=Lysinibacillus sp. CNPSo 3705 TaxID=3028148 RepID=UPI0023648CB9|nr:DUF771 domain-containing protein [Lysinibacillus sp. CNPSo 3705]MDD1503505.1 DUF771 domain-containing protein [Lysinibacillus sp. CNPSo 3705]
MQTQHLNVTLSISIPEDMVLIKKVELEKLNEQSLTGVYWTMKDLEQRTNKKQAWLKENILYPSRFKKQLDVNCGGFVYYPTKSGEKWAFLASKMSKFLEDNFYLIFSK